MRYHLFLIFSVLIAHKAFSQSTPTHHNISIKIAPYSNCTIYLGAYYGKGQILADSTHLNLNGEGNFNGNSQLTDGLYFIASPQKKILFEFLMSDGQHFNITADTCHRNNVKYTGSPDNNLFKSYINYATAVLAQNNVLIGQYLSAKTHADSLFIKKKLAVLNTNFNKFRDSLIHSSPNSLTALLITAGKQAELPPNLPLKTKKDTLNALNYIRKHFWQDVPFNDDRLLYTPFFETKIDNYYNYYVSPVADSVINELQYMLLYARTGKQMYPYLLIKFTNQYFNPPHAGQNKVLLYLFNNFYLKGDTALLNPAAKKMLFDRVYQLMANQIGDKAPPLDMTDINGNPSSLYNLSSPYTLIVFWDPTCPHCQQELPHLDSIYNSKWKANGVKIYCVNVNGTSVNAMKNFISDKHLSKDWIFAYQTEEAQKLLSKRGLPNYLQLYDVANIPTLYLLDAEKHIIAKDLNIDQLNRLIQLKSK